MSEIKDFASLKAYIDSLPSQPGTVGVDVEAKAVNLCDSWRFAGPMVKFLFALVKPLIGQKGAAILTELEASLDITCPPTP